MEREDPRNADRPAGNILAPSYLLALSCRISAVQHTAKLSFSSPFSSLPRRGIFRGVSKRSNTLEPGENYCILKRKQWNSFVGIFRLNESFGRSSPMKIMNHQILVTVMPMDEILSGSVSLDYRGIRRKNFSGWKNFDYPDL